MSKRHVRVEVFKQAKSTTYLTFLSEKMNLQSYAYPYLIFLLGPNLVIDNYRTYDNFRNQNPIILHILGYTSITLSLQSSSTCQIVFFYQFLSIYIFLFICNISVMLVHNIFPRPSPYLSSFFCLISTNLVLYVAYSLHTKCL